MHFEKEEDNPFTDGNGTCARYAKGILLLFIVCAGKILFPRFDDALM